MAIVAVMCDSREPKWVQELTFGGAMSAVTLLEHGDLWATTDDGAMVIVERKTADDLLGSLSDDRLWHQLAGMRQRSPWSYLVITGRLEPSASGLTLTERGETGWNWASVQGALIQAQELGVFVVHAGSDQEYEATVMRLCSRHRTADIALKPVRRPAILSAAEQVLCALPGIGMERAQSMLRTAGTAAWALIFLTQSTNEIPGVGEVTRRRAREALGLRPGERLVLVDAEGRGMDPWNTDDTSKETQHVELARSA